MAKQAMHYWATPQANADAGSRNCEGSAAHQGTSLADQVTTGSSSTGRQGNKRRLNPRFVAWLMGFAPDWCDEVSRVDALRCLGNAVVPAQGEAALRLLLGEMAEYLASDEAVECERGSEDRPCGYRWRPTGLSEHVECSRPAQHFDFHESPDGFRLIDSSCHMSDEAVERETTGAGRR